MSIIPVRELGRVGVVTDIPGYNLPLNAFTKAINIRFDEGSVSRAPVFRNVKSSLGFTPRFAVGITPATGFDQLIMVSDSWNIKEYSSGTVSDRSGSISGSSDPRPFTATVLADILYLNREDRVPVYRLTNGTNFADLPNWDATHKAGSLRAYNDQLLALGLTEGSTNFPNRIRFSDITTANSVPGSWADNDPTKSSGFIDLVEMNTPIVDGAILGNDFIVYSSEDVYSLTFVGGQFIFNVRKLFSDAGLLNKNCVVEIEKKHFCLGRDDIYVHDGITKRSICDERIKNFIFGGLNINKADVCFVAHNETLNEVMFCYLSGDESVQFPNADRCNRAAVYNYRADTWSFMDLPNISAGTNVNIDASLTYANATQTYEGIGGSFYDLEDGRERHTVMVGESLATDGLTSDKIYGVDLPDNGKLPFQLDTEATKPPLLERIGIDMDEAGSAASNYLVLTRIFPQMDTSNPLNTTVSVQFGASDIPRTTPTYATAATFDIATDHKIDSRVSGRYLSYKLTTSHNSDFKFSGFDLDVTQTGAR